MKTKSVRKPTSIAFMPEIIEYLDKKSHEAWMSRSTYLNKIIYDMMIDEETKEESTNE